MNNKALFALLPTLAFAALFMLTKPKTPATPQCPYCSHGLCKTYSEPVELRNYVRDGKVLYDIAYYRNNLRSRYVVTMTEDQLFKGAPSSITIHHK
jgi:hypothetical protein